MYLCCRSISVKRVQWHHLRLVADVTGKGHGGHGGSPGFAAAQAGGQRIECA